MKKVKYLRFTNCISVIVKGQTYTIKNDDDRFEDILRLIKLDDEDSLERLLDITKQITSKLDITIRNGIVEYKDEKLPAALNRMIVAMYQQDINNITPLINFWNKLKLNPSYRPLNFLSEFIEANNIVINEKGNLILYKIVGRTNKPNVFIDLYTRKIEQTFNVAVEVPRNQVDDDIEQTCSHGLNMVASY